MPPFAWRHCPNHPRVDFFAHLGCRAFGAGGPNDSAYIARHLFQKKWTIRRPSQYRTVAATAIIAAYIRHTRMKSVQLPLKSRSMLSEL
jgi:hypothetical protein